MRRRGERPSTLEPPVISGPDLGRVRARVVTYGLLAVLGLAAVTDTEWWPVSSFRLFSGLRRETKVSWQVVTVDDSGVELPARVGRFGRSYRGAGHLVARLDPAGRGRACRTWLEAYRRRGVLPAGGLRVYRVVRRLPRREGHEAPVLRRHLVVSCR